jgi:hypothetical protein
MLALVEARVVLAIVLITASVAYALIRAGGKPQVSSGRQHCAMGCHALLGGERDPGRRA